ncbi:MAG TPA: hypothetical protein VMT18_15810, partial [Planctomycetota bacterium]|nr:hypothetical protein [Planctomycetota bacterium]
MDLRHLAGLAAVLALGAGSALWWLDGTVRAPDAVAPLADAPLAPAPAERVAVDPPRVALPLALDANVQDREPAAEPRGAARFGSWQPPERPDFEGPRVETFHSEGVREFAGTQVLDAHNRWQLDGPWLAWHASGQLEERGAYRFGLEDGPWEWWYEDGTPMAQGTWIDGLRSGRWTFWQENGAVGAVGHYVDGEGDGPWTLYHASGRPWIAGELAHGTPVGLWQVWNEDGTLDLERTGVWDDG